jgi:antitoxin (DNA-binding transcriptional repressor) of toxin-antitoxin stability system
LNFVKVAVAVLGRVIAVLVAATPPIVVEADVLKTDNEGQSVRVTDTVEPGFDEVEVGTALGF